MVFITRFSGGRGDRNALEQHAVRLSTSMSRRDGIGQRSQWCGLIQARCGA